MKQIHVCTLRTFTLASSSLPSPAVQKLRETMKRARIFKRYGAQESIPRNKFRQPMYPEPVFLNVYGAPELIPSNEFRQPM
jgi:hypothetical protein